MSKTEATFLKRNKNNICVEETLSKHNKMKNINQSFFKHAYKQIADPFRINTKENNYFIKNVCCMTHFH